MLETGVRQVRVAMAMVFGRRMNPRLVERLVDDALATLHEFGSPGEDVEQLVDGPFSDPNERRDLQTRALRRTARRLRDKSAFYRERFAAAGVDPAELTLESLRKVPVTLKDDIVTRGADMMCADPYLSTQTTGTTGTPTRVWLSRYEIELWPALIALSMLLRGEVRPGDCMQINLSSRATAAVQEDVELLRLANASARLVGQVPPDESLDQLLDRTGAVPTLLSGYPSYIGQLVTAARRRGLGPDDFRLRSLFVGGEVLSPTLADAARDTFGVRQINDNYGVTELLPAGGRTCDGGHLHLDLNMGYSEVIGLDSGEPAGVGELGTLVVTPFYPYRECMPVLRYDTRDVVRVLPEELDCELAGVPAVSKILGKESRMLRTSAGIVGTREVVETLDTLPGIEWPSRFRAGVADDGRLHVVLAASGQSPSDVVKAFADRDIDATAEVVELSDDEVRRFCPLRCDLREETFTRAPAPKETP
ncbi:phenylacetate--CoA ligase family protein [Actinomadura harenae]|uniref:Phenylacetate--CoA ligase family protein n=1 Tax=Actinomadura harenae TaxID=2483351 RepID=A0A3M2LJ31_9ACTN|nr:phenylacetate--CoA ligase family protein [Actinomadura harenae]RMI36533.1 phenylacetate--CoA ligase family protein [Actinomadura harenae]